MIYLLNLASTASPVPDQEDGLREGLDPSQVTPGLLGFIFTLVMVVAVIFLIRDMSKRIRRVRYQGMMDEAAAESPETPDGDDRQSGDRLPTDTRGSDTGADTGDNARSDTRPGTSPGAR